MTSNIDPGSQLPFGKRAVSPWEMCTFGLMRQEEHPFQTHLGKQKQQKHSVWPQAKIHGIKSLSLVCLSQQYNSQISVCAWPGLGKLSLPSVKQPHFLLLSAYAQHSFLWFLHRHVYCTAPLVLSALFFFIARGFLHGRTKKWETCFVSCDHIFTHIVLLTITVT